MVIMMQFAIFQELELPPSSDVADMARNKHLLDFHIICSCVNDYRTLSKAVHQVSALVNEACM